MVNPDSKTVAVPPPASSRIASIDLIRGAAMILMAIDHVRVYSGVPAGGPMPGIFFTRWITHFCAPAFIFLAGTSAWFYGKKHDDLSKFLFVRGLWLVILELTILRVAWTFNFDFMQYEMAGVIWVIGWCMIIMAGLVRLPLAAVGTIGIIIVAGHNIMDMFLNQVLQAASEGSLTGLVKILYVGFFAGPIQLGPDGPNLIVLYSIVPWIGVMATGFAFGKILTYEPVKRNRLCLVYGLGALALFALLRGLNVYGDPRPWSAATQRPDGSMGMPGMLSFLNTTKYPASLNFLLMTLGPTLALVPVLEHVSGMIGRWISVFGKVPFFFYVLHIPLIHALALLISEIRTPNASWWLFTNHPMGNPPAPEGYVWSLPLLYLVWAIAIIILSFACRWFARVKAGSRAWWLKFV